MNIYAGPGKLLFGGVAIWPQQVNGELIYSIDQSKLDHAQAMHGRVGSNLGNTIGKLTVTPYDNWSALPVLYPPYIGATTPGTGHTGVLLVGQRPHNPAGAADMPGIIWNPSTLSIAIKRLAVTRHPDIHLGVGKPLYGQMEFTALPSSTNGNDFVAIGSAQAFHLITESGAADPGGQFDTVDFVREAWTATWGDASGFVNMQAEDEWTISCNVQYDELRVQEQTLAMKLASVEFMARARIVGPKWTEIEAAAVTNRLLGSRWGHPGTQAAAKDLVITSNGSGKKITLPNCDVHGEGFEFGGARLATGELGFVTQQQFSGGAPLPLIIFA